MSEGPNPDPALRAAREYEIRQAVEAELSFLPPDVIVIFDDGSRWQFSATIVADARARYYAEVDSARGDGDYETVYSEEYRYTLTDDYELRDWMSNNMNWADVEPYATRLPDDPRHAPDYAREWTNADREIVRRVEG